MEQIGKCIAGNGRLKGGQTLADKYPERYGNNFADFVNLVIAHVKAEQSLKEDSENDPRHGDLLWDGKSIFKNAQTSLVLNTPKCEATKRALSTTDIK